MSNASTGMAGTAGKTLPVPGEVFSFEEFEAFVIMPNKRTDGEKIPWVFYAPTLPVYPCHLDKWMFEKFLDAGIAIAGIDVGESFGSPKGTAAMAAFHDELAQKRAFAVKACLLPNSRGGLMLYNWAARHPDCVACIAGIYPVGDLRSYPGLDKACEAYGLTEAELATNLTQYNPIDLLETLADAHIPIFHIHGDADMLVPLEKNSGELTRRYRQLGGKMTLNVAQGQGHSDWNGFFRCCELVDFIITHSRN